MKIGFSIEVSPAQVLGGKLAADLLPAKTRIYMTDIGTDSENDMIAAAKKINDLGYACVPHIAARRIESETMLQTRLQKYQNEAGVNDLLCIAGEAEKQMGPYDCSLKVLQSGFIDEFGFQHVAVAGHPEGNDSYAGENLMNVLHAKYDFAKQCDFEMRITTQFGFDGELFVAWAKQVQEAGIDLPIHMGVAGPAKITTLIKYAAMCGVGNSMQFFKKRTKALAHLTTGHSPEEVVAPIEKAWQEKLFNIKQIHIFAFGGLANTKDWLVKRGSIT